MIISPNLSSLFLLWGKYNDNYKNIVHFKSIINKYRNFTNVLFIFTEKNLAKTILLKNIKLIYFIKYYTF
jgi:hypothetical protein